MPYRNSANLKIVAHTIEKQPVTATHFGHPWMPIKLKSLCLKPKHNWHQKSLFSLLASATDKEFYEFVKSDYRRGRRRRSCFKTWSRSWIPEKKLVSISWLWGRKNGGGKTSRPRDWNNSYKSSILKSGKGQVGEPWILNFKCLMSWTADGASLINHQVNLTTSSCYSSNIIGSFVFFLNKISTSLTCCNIKRNFKWKLNFALLPLP